MLQILDRAGKTLKEMCVIRIDHRVLPRKIGEHLNAIATYAELARLAVVAGRRQRGETNHFAHLWQRCKLLLRRGSHFIGGAVVSLNRVHDMIGFLLILPHLSSHAA
ncbi:MAG: hypothetical protein ACUVXB_11620 [Bryobacteraceae bacterium]